VAAKTLQFFFIFLLILFALSHPDAVRKSGVKSRRYSLAEKKILRFLIMCTMTTFV
jgi:hypothetical protein